MWLLWMDIAAWQHRIRRLGGFGLIVVGILDNSVVPMPGSMDALTIVLSARNGNWWPAYVVTAVVGSMLGAYITYRMASKGGKETLEKKIGKKRAEQVYGKFQRGGFATVFVGCMLPPPFPLVPVIMAAGAMQYPAKKFLGAVAAGRGIRYTAAAYIGHRYGTGIIGFFSHYRRPLLYAVVSLAVVAGMGAAVYFGWYRRRAAAVS
ncbi:MAG TPA: VTT domain-containing protein [Terriglobales bacterium]|jgi:membrane protein YqaA with SNARE-associated domain|nr:VTT domain-containing protein [Terriglobales bacterium]